MAGENDLNLIETNESDAPSYDTSTDMVHDPDLNNGQGGKRAPHALESVKAAFLQEKAKIDPMERYRQKIERNGGSMVGTLKKVEEFDNIPDLVDKHRWVDRQYNADSRTVAQHILDNTTATQQQMEGFQGEIERARQSFDQKHPEAPIGSPIRDAAVKILQEFHDMGKDVMADKRFKSCTTVEEVYDKALDLAKDQHPSYRIQKMLEERDAERDRWRSGKAAKATI